MLNMVFLLLLSLPVGFLGALTGLGGASILIPILVSLGIPVKEAIACGMVPSLPLRAVLPPLM